jgi:hypothetical protein
VRPYTQQGNIGDGQAGDAEAEAVHRRVENDR